MKDGYRSRRSLQLVLTSQPASLIASAVSLSNHFAPARVNPQLALSSSFLFRAILIQTAAREYFGKRWRDGMQLRKEIPQPRQIRPESTRDTEPARDTGSAKDKVAKAGPARVERTKQKASPWKLGGLTTVQLGKRVYKEFDNDEVLTRSAALSYYFMGALIPMLFFLVSCLGIFGKSHDLRHSLFTYIQQFMPPDAFSILQKTMREVVTHSSGLKLAIGLVLALWSGSGGMRSIMDALNRCYHVKESRPLWKSVPLSMALTAAISALTIAALVIVLYGGAIAQFVGDHTGLSSITVLLWKGVQWPLAFFFVVLAFATIYYWAPDADQQWAWITPGSLTGVILWIAASICFRVYLHYFNSYGKTYGSLGAVIVLLLWLYITGMAILVGGEINSEIENAAAKRGHPEAKDEGEKAA
jgi:membrane protein